MDGYEDVEKNYKVGEQIMTTDRWGTEAKGKIDRIEGVVCWVKLKNGLSGYYDSKHIRKLNDKD